MATVTETVRCWLVERSYDDKGMVHLVYATEDGERRYRQQFAADRLARTSVTAAREIDAERLSPVDDSAVRQRYATEVERVATANDPDDEM
jgi:hypothetical protein